MTIQQVFALLCFALGFVLGVAAAFVPPTRGILEPLAIAAIALGLAIQAVHTS